MEIGKCAINADEVIASLEKEKTLILATCAGNRVTIRPMSHINDGLLVYFQTGKDYLKIQQIKANPYVAFCVGTYEIEGKAAILGHPLDEANGFFAEKFKAKHPGSFERWSSLADEVVVRIDIGLVRQWRYIDDKPYEAVGRFNAEAYGGSEL